jgi:hypothetical protein
MCITFLFLLVRKEDSNFERKSLILRFLSQRTKLRTRACTLKRNLHFRHLHLIN